MQARPLLSGDGKVEALVDPRLGGDYDGEQARRVTFVASLCVRAAATWRPSMTEVRPASCQAGRSTSSGRQAGRSPDARVCFRSVARLLKVPTRARCFVCFSFSPFVWQEDTGKHMPPCVQLPAQLQPTAHSTVCLVYL